MMKKTLFSILITLGLSLTGCSYALEELGVFKTSNEIPKIDVFQFSEQTITFEVVKNFSMRTCLECHASGNHSMNTAEKVLSLKADILQTLNEGSMPPKAGGYKPLTACERQVLETWFSDQEQGRTESLKVKDLTECTDVQAPKEKIPVDFKNLELNFANLKKEILEPKCLSCHTEETARDTILDNIEYINENELVAKTAEESVLYLITVPGKYKRFMPPKKTGIAPLTADEQDYLKRWIEAGTPL